MSKIILSMVALVLASLALAACGNESANNNNFEVPVVGGINEQNQLSNDPNLRNALLTSARPEIVGQKLTIYTTARPLAEIQSSYRTEFTARGWTDVSASVIGNKELKEQGTVEAFEKYVGGDVNKKHIVGILLLTPEAIAKLPETSLIKAPLRGTSNVVITVQGATGIPAP